MVVTVNKEGTVATGCAFPPKQASARYVLAVGFFLYAARPYTW